MSFFSNWKIPEPHDARVRAASLQQSLPRSAASVPTQSVQPDSADVVADPRSFSSPRAQKQFAVFLAGAGFLAFSTLITRRALVRKYHQTKPAGQFSPSNNVAEVNGGVEAAEALSLATINVASVALFLTGGAAWALDISTLEDLRRTLRSKLDVPGAGHRSDAEAEDDIEEWIALAMAKLQGKSEVELVGMAKEIVERGKTSADVKNGGP